jgi:hypothetical protein
LRAIGQGGPKVLKAPVSDFMTKTVVTGAAGRYDQLANVRNDGTSVPSHARLESERLVGLVSIGDLVTIHIAEIEMEAAATREYTA